MNNINIVNTKKTYVILLAAGSGSRIYKGLDAKYQGYENSRIKKQFIMYQGDPLWWHSAQKFHFSPHIKGIILVFPDNDLEFEKACENAKNLHNKHNVSIPFYYVKGGDERYQSVYNALNVLPKDCSHVLVHDSARPFFSNELVHALMQALCSDEKNLAVIPAICLTDTIKIIAETPNSKNAPLEKSSLKRVESTPKRELLRAVQTPQVFQADALLDAYHKYFQQEANGKSITDDAMLMELAGYTVYLIDGEEFNIKITHAKDLALLENNIKHVPCSGFGYDVHRFGGTRPFKLGGIAFPTDLQIEAHSDGDVLIHALIDALLSCMCLGDIGMHFPDTDEKNENISSSLMLDYTMDLWRKSGLILCHVDLTIITQKPKIAPFAKEISKNLARLLSISTSCINTKSTTEEKLGFTGNLEGIKAVALVSALKEV